MTSWNDEIKTKRLILHKASNARDLNLFKKHLKEDGDFTLYSGMKDTPENINLFSLEMPGDYYSIYLNENDLMIGYIALTPSREGIRDMELYIFKEFRRLHYCTEACQAILSYYKSKESGNRVTASTIAENIPCIKFLEYIGFKPDENIPMDMFMVLSDSDSEDEALWDVKPFVLFLN